jgi:hypothetical protein
MSANFLSLPSELRNNIYTSGDVLITLVDMTLSTIPRRIHSVWHKRVRDLSEMSECPSR